MTVAESWTLRRALWGSQRWNQPINLDAAAAAVGKDIADQVTVELMARRQVDVSDLAAVPARIEARMREVLGRVVANLEAEGLAVEGIEGSIERAMASLALTIGSPEGTV